jgi:hypothetical protein
MLGSRRCVFCFVATGAIALLCAGVAHAATSDPYYRLPGTRAFLRAMGFAVSSGGARMGLRRDASWITVAFGGQHDVVIGFAKDVGAASSLEAVVVYVEARVFHGSLQGARAGVRHKGNVVYYSESRVMTLRESNGIERCLR